MIRILLAEEYRLLRVTLTAYLDSQPDFRVVAELAVGSGLLARASADVPDVAVLDRDLPEVDGITVAAGLRTALPDCRTLILACSDKPGELQRALAAGASGYVDKDTDPGDLAAAIRTVATGGRVIDPQFAVSALAVPANPLTPREAEVLRLAAQGDDAPEVAQRLFLSVGTVRNYLTSAVAKTHARNRVDAVRISLENGWI
jgi:two-component system response regulator DesR